MRERHPERWGSSVAAYLYAGESYQEAAQRRLWEELGLEGPLRRIGKTRMADERSLKFVELYTLLDGPADVRGTEPHRGASGSDLAGAGRRHARRARDLYPDLPPRLPGISYDSSGLARPNRRPALGAVQERSRRVPISGQPELGPVAVLLRPERRGPSNWHWPTRSHGRSTGRGHAGVRGWGVQRRTLRPGDRGSEGLLPQCTGSEAQA